MLAGKVIIEGLPTGGNDTAERRIFSQKGEMAQILNRPSESFRHLVYWDLDSSSSAQERGGHYHRQKTEHFYVIAGELDLLVEDLETGAKEKAFLQAGDRLTINPRVAHAFRSRIYSQVLEYSPDPYDPGDAVPFRVEL
jgi:mannose-6-phosphate isomerase-like protein (cupin superfamily)